MSLRNISTILANVQTVNFPSPLPLKIPSSRLLHLWNAKFLWFESPEKNREQIFPSLILFCSLSSSLSSTPIPLSLSFSLLFLSLLTLCVLQHALLYFEHKIKQRERKSKKTGSVLFKIILICSFHAAVCKLELQFFIFCIFYHSKRKKNLLP